MTAASQENNNQKNSPQKFKLSSYLFRKTGNTIVTLTVIAYLSLFVLMLAERGRAHLPAQPLSTAGEAFIRLFNYLFHHPQIYAWQHLDAGAFSLVFRTFINSAGLLLLAIAFAAFVGVFLGIIAALSRGRIASSLVLTFSVLGMSTPSFLFAMLLWIFNIQVIQRSFGWKALPPTGFGWDLHLLMPALVLAARPMAQIAQVTYISLREILGEDYIRTAHSKGLPKRLVYIRHALRNILIPVLTTVGTSLRYSIASLPVVEFFFIWPGIGLTLLQAIALGNTPLVTDLIVTLGLFFVFFNLALDLIYPLLDARLRKDDRLGESLDKISIRELIKGFMDTVQELWLDLMTVLRIRKRTESQLPDLPSHEIPGHLKREAPAINRPKFIQWLRWIFSNPALLLGSLLVFGFLIVMIFGENLVPGNPYEMTGVIMIDGTIGAPPFEPSSTFPWGSDHLGRDIQALVFSGGRRTLSLAFAIMLARLVVGSLLGVIAGWWQDSGFDRFIMRLLNIWAAFPITIFAMLLIQAIGIQQGVWVFIVALCVVGWGEVTQFVRSQTIRIKPQLFIEASRSLGANAVDILVRQVFPNLVTSLLVIAALEMGGILMLLAELGFLNIFLGGGFRVELFVGPSVIFSDIPEWGALLANIRDWWRSYPWMAWYPGVAFFLSIITFNLFGEGLRRFLEDSRVNLNRLLNRYTLLATLAAVGVFAWVMQSQSAISTYREVASQFDETRAMQVISDLTNPIFHGRESGTSADALTAEYISYQMEYAGLFPADGDGSFIHSMPVSRLHVIEQPRLEILDAEGTVIRSFDYRREFADFGGPGMTYGEDQGQLMGVVLGPQSGDGKQELSALSQLQLADKTILVRAIDYGRQGLSNAAMILVVASDAQTLQQKRLYFAPFYRGRAIPTFWISESVADQLLTRVGSSLEKLDQKAGSLKSGEIFATEPGLNIHGSVMVEERSNDQYHLVIGILPGEGSAMGQAGQALDNQVTIVSAYYDSVGDQPDGVIYPGANDNASGVAVMLEAARLMKQSPFAPKRTVLFVAWSGGERGDELDINNVMGSSRSLIGFVVNDVIEISGVGAGDGKGINLGGLSSYRLVDLAQKAAKRLGLSVSTRGRGPHFNIVSETATRIQRDVPTMYLSWDGSDANAHTLQDTLENIDPNKLNKSGQLIMLILLVLSREMNY